MEGITYGTVIFGAGIQRGYLGWNKIRDSFGYDIPSDTTGECWAISAHKNGDCKIAGGRYDGRYLSQLWEEESKVWKLSGQPVSRF